MLVKPQAPTTNVAASNNNGVTFTDEPATPKSAAPASQAPVQNREVQTPQSANVSREANNTAVSATRPTVAQNENNDRVSNSQSVVNNNCNTQQTPVKRVVSNSASSNLGSASVNAKDNSNLNTASSSSNAKAVANADSNTNKDLGNVKKVNARVSPEFAQKVQEKTGTSIKPTINNDASVPNLNLATNTVAPKSLGIDVSGYQGTNLTPYARDGAKFAIVKLSEGTSYYNPNAAGQIKSAEQNGMMTMGYHFARFGSSTTEADAEARHAIANAQLYGLPKGSYLACDYEDGCGAGSNVQANTAAVMEFMKDVQNAGYIPLLYSGRYYMQSKLNLNEICNTYGKCLWVAQYPTTAPVSGPDFNYFPSMNNVLIWQYSDNWHGVDGDVSVLPLSSNSHTAPATSSGSSSSSSSSSSHYKTNYKIGDEVTINPSAKKWTNGSLINHSITNGHPYEVIQVAPGDGGAVCLKDPKTGAVMGWANDWDVTPYTAPAASKPAAKPAPSTSKPAANNKPATTNKPASQPADKPAASQTKGYTGQKYVNGHWQYWNNGTPVKNTYEWLGDQKKETYYDNNGNMVYGWQTINGQKRYFDPITGAQAKSCTLTINGQKWTFDSQGNPTLDQSSTPTTTTGSASSSTSTVTPSTPVTPAGSASASTPAASSTTSSAQGTFSPSTPISINGSAVGGNSASNTKPSTVANKGSQSANSKNNAKPASSASKTTTNPTKKPAASQSTAKKSAGKTTVNGKKTANTSAKKTVAGKKAQVNGKAGKVATTQSSAASQSGKGNQWQSQGQHVNDVKHPAKVVKASTSVAQLAAQRVSSPVAGNMDAAVQSNVNTGNAATNATQASNVKTTTPSAVQSSNAQASSSSNGMPATGMSDKTADELGAIGAGLVLSIAAKRSKKTRRN